MWTKLIGWAVSAVVLLVGAAMATETEVVLIYGGDTLGFVEPCG